MDLFSSDNNDLDYYVEYESGDEARNWSSGDEVEYNHELEDSTESFENDVNKLRENIERRRSLNNDDFEMQDEMYMGPGEKIADENAGSSTNELSNDDLLYDPNVDVDNENWMHKERQKHIPKRVSLPNCGSQIDMPQLQDQGSQASNDIGINENTIGSGNIRSDAVLNCPACMVTVCIDCQRHEIYKTQYRAMFVMHCKVDRSELLRYEKKRKGRKKKSQECPGKLVPADSNDDQEIELFNPVKCTECGTVLAVYDSEEVYHFFNILASQA